MKYKNLERKEYELTCISPIHIGNGEILKGYEYLYDKQHQCVYFLDEGKWIRFLQQHHLMDAFAVYIQETAKAMQPKKPFHGMMLWEWLRTKGITALEMSKLGQTTSTVTTNNNISVRNSLNDVHRLVVQCNGEPYIPGSSLKGFLRTGLLHWYLEKHPEVCRSIGDTIKRNPFRRMGQTTKQLEQDVFSCLTIKSHDVISPMVKSCMRGLLVSDAQLYDTKAKTMILQKIDATTKENKLHETEKKLPIFRECIPIGTKFRFNITMDRTMMAELGIHATDEIIAAAREYAQSVLAMERKAFGRSYKGEFKESEDADLILGGGTGFQSKTVFYTILSPDKEGRGILAKKLDENFPKHKHQVNDHIISPRTLKLTRTNTDRCIMGLCYVNEVK
jgi:CRISPR-associated protein Csm5